MSAAGVYYPISFNEISISGVWGQKLISELIKESAYLHHDSFEFGRRKFVETRKICLEGFNVVITTNQNKIVIESDYVYKQEYIKDEITRRLNDYITNLLQKIQDEELKNKVLEFSWNKDSINSKHHIFNLEMLCSCAIRKPHLFNMIHNVMTNKNVLTKCDDYKYYIFAMFDVEDIKIVEEIYDYLLEEYADNKWYDQDNRNKSARYTFKTELEQKLSEEENSKIKENMSKLLLIM